MNADVPEIGINVTALDDTGATDLLPRHASFRDDAAPWLPPPPETTPGTSRSPRADLP